MGRDLAVYAAGPVLLRGLHDPLDPHDRVAALDASLAQRSASAAFHARSARQQPAQVAAAG